MGKSTKKKNKKITAPKANIQELNNTNTKIDMNTP